MSVENDILNIYLLFHYKSHNKSKVNLIFLEYFCLCLLAQWTLIQCLNKLPVIKLILKFSGMIKSWKQQRQKMTTNIVMLNNFPNIVGYSGPWNIPEAKVQGSAAVILSRITAVQSVRRKDLWMNAESGWLPTEKCCTFLYGCILNRCWKFVSNDQKTFFMSLKPSFRRFLHVAITKFIYYLIAQ